MTDQKNTILAIVLSALVLIAWQIYFGVPQMEKQKQTQQQQAQERSQQPPPLPQQPGATQAPSAPGTAPQATQPGAAAQPMTRDATLAASPRVRIETPSLSGSIALKGGRIDDVTLATYHETTDPKSPEVILLWPTGTKEPYFAEFGWVAASTGVKVPGPDTLWAASNNGALTPTSPVTLTWDNGAGLAFSRTISVDQNYMFTVRDAVKNSGSTPVKLSSYGLISRTGTPQVSGYYILFEGLLGELDGSLREIKYPSLKPGEPVDYDSTGGWLGFTDKYWLTALVPDQGAAIKARFNHRLEGGVDRYQTDFLGPAQTVPADGTLAASTRFFAGAKEVNLLNAYSESGIRLFEYSIDFGWFWFLTKPIFQILQFFAGVLGNFGLAILLLTFIIKLLFFPLANKSYSAMSKMKLLQPEMQKIRERFPEDKARQQQEIMAMYKKVGANPLAGCLPIVIQIPVFFSLYKVLFVTIEMRHAPFYGWIHDLSAPDPTSFANLFGLIPFTPPHILMIGVWPLIMGLTMFLQQKLNPQPVDPMQARMFMLLPIVFTYMLSSFPAGLVIYWAWNNLLSIAQQWTIMHRAGAA
jgi:YidC/Oxa1 family membrane protein insertase